MSDVREVECARLGRRLPGLPKPPFSGALGQRIFEQISAEAWKMWENEAVIVMNHHGLSLADPAARRFLMQQMEAFLFGGLQGGPRQERPPGSEPA